MDNKTGLPNPLTDAKRDALTIKVQFKSSQDRPIYVGAFELKNGEARLVSEKEAKRLTTDFPNNFSIVEPPKERQAQPAENRLMSGKGNR